MKNEEKEKLLKFYYDNDSAELKSIINGVLFRLNYSQCNDLDEFYSIANMECWKAIERYESDNEWGATFKTYLSGILINRFITEINKRGKRSKINGKDIISLDNEACGLEDVALIDTIPSEEDTENEVLSSISSNTTLYLNSLSTKQRHLAELIMSGYSLNDARIDMKLSKTEFENMLKFMRSNDKRAILNRSYEKQIDIQKISKGEQGSMKNQTTMEKSKNTRYNVREIKKKMDNGTFNFHHPLQRSDSQWSNKQKSDLISDIIQGNPIPALIFAEQIIDGNCITFDLDGKQRCTTVREYVNDQFKISKNVTRNIIQYQATVKDETGRTVYNSKGYPVFEWIDYDISNKKFSQLPVELQDRILDYNFDVTLYLNCSDEDIAYHIQRYNQGKAMNSAQKGITYLGEDFAREVKAITGLPFFQDNGFTFKQYNNGTFNRIVIESVMAIYFLDDWKKSPEEIAMYLNKNAKFSMFENVEDLITRLQDVITPDVADTFDAKNTFLWLTLFNRFNKFELEDSKFIEFLQAFNNELKYKKINGNTFVSIDSGKNTKDKSVLIAKIEHLSNLMKDFFGIDLVA